MRPTRHKIICVLLRLLSNKQLTRRQMYDLLICNGYYKKRNNKYAGYKQYRFYGSEVRKQCKTLLRFNLIKKVRKIKTGIRGIYPWLFDITSKGKKWLEIQNDINTIYKNRT